MVYSVFDEIVYFLVVSSSLNNDNAVYIKNYRTNNKNISIESIRKKEN